MISRNKSQLYAKFLCHILKVAVWHIMNGSLANLCARTLNDTLYDTRISTNLPIEFCTFHFSISDSSINLKRQLSLQPLSVTVFLYIYICLSTFFFEKYTIALFINYNTKFVCKVCFNVTYFLMLA